MSTPTPATPGSSSRCSPRHRRPPSGRRCAGRADLDTGDRDLADPRPRETVHRLRDDRRRGRRRRRRVDPTTDPSILVRRPRTPQPQRGDPAGRATLGRGRARRDPGAGRHHRRLGHRRGERLRATAPAGRARPCRCRSHPTRRPGSATRPPPSRPTAPSTSLPGPPRRSPSSSCRPALSELGKGPPCSTCRPDGDPRRHDLPGLRRPSRYYYVHSTCGSAATPAVRCSTSSPSVAGGVAGTATAGGFLTMTVDCDLGPLYDAVKGARRPSRAGDLADQRALPQRDGAAHRPRRRRAPATGSVPSVAAGPRFVEQVLGAGVPSLDASNRAIFCSPSARMGSPSLGILQGTANARPLGVVYNLEYVGLLPAYGVETPSTPSRALDFMRPGSASGRSLQGRYRQHHREAQERETTSPSRRRPSLELSTPEAIAGRTKSSTTSSPPYQRRALPAHPGPRPAEDRRQPPDSDRPDRSSANGHPATGQTRPAGGQPQPKPAGGMPPPPHEPPPSGQTRHRAAGPGQLGPNRRNRHRNRDGGTGTGTGTGTTGTGTGGTGTGTGTGTGATGTGTTGTGTGGDRDRKDYGRGTGTGTGTGAASGTGNRNRHWHRGRRSGPGDRRDEGVGRPRRPQVAFAMKSVSQRSARRSPTARAVDRPERPGQPAGHLVDDVQPRRARPAGPRHRPSTTRSSSG